MKDSSPLVVAPLGEQPTAVAAPLLSEHLSAEDAEVALVGTGRTSWLKVDERVTSTLLERGRRVAFVTTPSEIGLGAAARQDLAEMAQGRTVRLLANGGSWPLVQELIEHLEPVAADFEISVSRDHVGLSFNSDGAIRLPFVVPDIGLDSIRGLLGLYIDEATGVLQSGAHKLQTISMAEHGGQLFALIDASEMTHENPQKYRMTLLIRDRLLALGLDARRLCLARLPRETRSRARRDGIPYVEAVRKLDGLGGPRLIEEWHNLVSTGAMISVAEEMRASTTAVIPPLEPRPGDEVKWDGPPLVTIMGTQPGMTLRSIWRHRPRVLVVLYDEGSPTVIDHVTRLVELGQYRTLAVWPFSQLALLTQALVELGVAEDPLVDTTAGDKLATLQTYLWARQSGASFWRPTRRGQQDEGDVPLDTWLTLHSPMPITDKSTPASSGLEHEKALEMLADVRDADVMTRFATLEREEPPALAEGRLVLRSGSTALDHLGKLGHTLQSTSTRGAWLECSLAHALLKAGVKEVIWSVKVGQPDASGFSDERDVLTRHEGKFCHWSCKAGKLKSDKVRVAIIEARAQADRLLGWRRPAVLVVPRLESLPSEAVARLEEDNGLRRDAEFDVHVIDSRTLLDPEKLLAIAAARAAR